MSDSSIRYYCYPRTEPPPDFADDVAGAFEENEDTIGTEQLDDGLKSDEVLGVVREDLVELGFSIENGKRKEDKIKRPVLFGEGGEPDLHYFVDGYQPEWNCGIEVEAGRAWKGNAIYRDLIQALVMVQVDTLVLAVPNIYKYSSGNNPAFDKTKDVVETLYATERFDPPYRLILIGY